MEGNAAAWFLGGEEQPTCVSKVNRAHTMVSWSGLSAWVELVFGEGLIFLQRLFKQEWVSAVEKFVWLACDFICIGQERERRTWHSCQGGGKEEEEEEWHNLYFWLRVEKGNGGGGRLMEAEREHSGRRRRPWRDFRPSWRVKRLCHYGRKRNFLRCIVVSLLEWGN